MKRLPVAVVGMVLLVAGAGVGGYILTTQPRPVEPPHPTVQAQASQPAAVPQTVLIYGVAVEGGREELKSAEIKVEPGSDPMEAALRRLIEQGLDKPLANPIPGGTRLLSFGVKNGTATVDMSAEFSDNFSGGSDAECLAVGAILKTLGQFDEIERVQLLCDGKTPELGHLDLSEPLGVNDLDSDYGGGN